MIAQRELYKPKMMLAIYQDDNTNSVYVESSDTDQNGNPTAWEPLTVAKASELGQALITETSENINGEIPTNVVSLKWNGMKPVLHWWTPAQKRFLTFTEELHIPNGYYELPALEWIYDTGDDCLVLYALKENERPDRNTKRYYAPFHNISNESVVCLGTASSYVRKKGDTTFIDLMTHVMESFFNSQFSHLSYSNIVRGNLNMILVDLVNTGNPFPLDILKQVNHED